MEKMTVRGDRVILYRDYEGLNISDLYMLEEKNLTDARVSVTFRMKPEDGPEKNASFSLMTRYRMTKLYGQFYYAAVVEQEGRLCLYKAFANRTNQVYGTAKLLQTGIPESGGNQHSLEIETEGMQIRIYYDHVLMLQHTDQDGVVNEAGAAAVSAGNAQAELGEVLITGSYREKSMPEKKSPAFQAEKGPDPEEYEPAGDPDRPIVYYTGNTWHLPGEIAMVRGANLGGVCSLQIGRLPDQPPKEANSAGYLARESYRSLRPASHVKEAAIASLPEESAGLSVLQPSDESLKFRLPADVRDGVYSVRLTWKDGTKFGYYLNAPAVEWVQADEGNIATPGGWIRVQGYNLAPSGAEDAARIILRGQSGEFIRKPDRIYDMYSAELKVPDTMPEGEYEVLYYNGYGDATACSEPVMIRIGPSPRSLWPDTVFDVTEYGAAGDGRTNDTEAIRRTMRAAEANGGGVVWFPAGRYYINAGFEIPKQTIMRGYSAVRTQIYLTPFAWDYEELAGPVIRGTSDFAIEDITFAGSRTPIFIQAGTKIPENTKNVYIRRCRFYFNSAAGVVTGNWNGELYGLIMNECCHRFDSDLLRIGGENIQLEDNDILSSGRPIAGGRKTCFLMRNNRIKPHVSNWSPFGRLNGAIIEDNQFEAHTAGCSGDNVYYARNSMKNGFNNNREAFTTDLGSGRYNGSVTAGWNSRTLVLADADFPENSKAGFGLFLIQGKGAGQYRRILSNTSDTVTLDLPFAIPPDSDTVCSIMEIRNNMFFSDNVVYNAGVMQFYGMQTNSLFAGTKIARGIGFWGSGRFVYGVYQPNWYCSFLENELSDGIYYWQYGYDAQSGNAQIKISARGGLAGMNVATLVRRNRLLDNSTIFIDTGCETDAMQDLVIENNEIRDVPKGIVLGIGEKTARGLILSGNSCINTEEPLYVPNPECLTASDSSGEARILRIDEHY